MSIVQQRTCKTRLFTGSNRKSYSLFTFTITLIVHFTEVIKEASNKNLFLVSATEGSYILINKSTAWNIKSLQEVGFQNGLKFNTLNTARNYNITMGNCAFSSVNIRCLTSCKTKLLSFCRVNSNPTDSRKWEGGVRQSSGTLVLRQRNKSRF